MPRLRKDLCADSLIAGIRASFEKITDFRNRSSISMPDIVMSAFGIFSLKYPSLLAFEKGMSMPDPASSNMRSLFGVERIPSDTYMREVIDQISPDSFRPSFKHLFNELQRGRVLDKYRFLDDFYLISMDGTGLFSSTQVSCPCCMEKVSKKDGLKTFYHQMLGMVMVHPDRKEVIPFCPEAIANADGANKNDCERNAAKRAIEKFRRDHPKLKAIILEDGLASNAPHISMLRSHNLSFILGAKPTDHKYLFEQASLAGSSQYYQEITEENGLKHRFRFVNNLSINQTHENVIVNLLEYEQWDEKKRKSIKFSWVTDIELTSENVFKIMRAGRSRWRIENETFNTLKNQGYNFEHNYGHGEKHLCTNFAVLMFLAFAVDQIQKICCKSYQEAREKTRTFYEFCSNVLYRFLNYKIANWASIFHDILHPVKVELNFQPP